MSTGSSTCSVIAVCTLLCGGEGYNDREDFGDAKEDWLKTFLQLPGGIPSHDTFNRLFQALDPQSFLECFARWTQSLRTAVPELLHARELAGAIVTLDAMGCQRNIGKEIKEADAD